MKTLTLTQPWATLVALGAKKIETRSWRTHYRGPLAIHAAAGFPPAARMLCSQAPFSEALGGTCWQDLPRGVVVAVVRVREVTSTTLPDAGPALMQRLTAQELAFGDYKPGRYAWEMDLLHALPVPMPAKGKLGFWEWAPPAYLQRLLERETP